ncbi:MAG: hypothetical protein KDJ47_08555 [Hyphomicrobiaceae bacterium]|nr:hypothetical protein [Hyphomicrobiaceae bacterium]
MDDLIILAKYLTFWALVNGMLGIWYLLHRMEQARIKQLRKEGFFRKHRYARKHFERTGKYPDDYPDDLPLP